MSEPDAYRYSSTDTRSLKRRRLDNGDAKSTFATSQSDQRLRKIPHQQSAQVSMPAPEVSLPVSFLHAQSPQDLSYAILTTDKALFTKQELLIIVAKLDHMYQPQFPEPCEYIN
jgi:hypothetical protein